MTIFAIDPGPIESGWCLLVDRGIVECGKWKNDDIAIGVHFNNLDVFAIERIASYGMAVGAEVFETCFWSGRFYQIFHTLHPKTNVARPTRKEIVTHLCGSAKAKDGNVRQALIDRWGAPGKKSAPGPTYGITGDMWAALAVATYVLDTVKE
jgi:hypothetical protein